MSRIPNCLLAIGVVAVAGCASSNQNDVGKPPPQSASSAENDPFVEQMAARAIEFGDSVREHTEAPITAEQRDAWTQARSGMTKDQIESLLGSPNYRLGNVRWMYYYTGLRDGVVRFDESGRVRSVQTPME